MRYLMKNLEFPRTFTGTRMNPPSSYLDRGITPADGTPDYEGAQFTDGTVVIRWRTAYRSTSVFASFREFYAVHGHPEYGTVITFRDGYDGWLNQIREGGRADDAEPAGQGVPENVAVRAGVEAV
jgi:hypothetical protein